MLTRLLLVLAVLGWLWWSSPAFRRGGWRLFGGLGALALIVVGAVLVIRGAEWIGLPLVALALALAFGSRLHRAGMRGAARFSATPEPAGMSAAEARSILGVAPDASVADIRAAYSRLMRMAHPDKGGTTGLAAQLNAARDRLLKRP
jgi:hypothetical protein